MLGLLYKECREEPRFDEGFLSLTLRRAPMRGWTEEFRMRLTAEVVEAFLVMLKEKLDARKGIGPESQDLPINEKVEVLTGEIERGVERLTHAAKYYAPPEHVDTQAVEVAASALALAGVVGRLGRQGPKTGRKG
jgi:hypothetical protein